MWKTYNPKFDYKDDLNDELLPWVGHIHFGYDLVANMQPKTIVELGTFKGTSLFSFAQAVKDMSLDTTIYAVDSWVGDEHAGFYGDEIYQNVVDITRRHYARQKVRLVRKYFDDAVSDFEDKSINILHIDGLHTYEAVLNDFQKWSPKVSDDGIILFHDIFVADFGVWKVWEEIQKQFPQYLFIELKNNYGLGIIFKNKGENDNIFTNSFFCDYYAMKAELSLKNYELQKLTTECTNKDKEITNLNNNIQQMTAALNDQQIKLDKQQIKLDEQRNLIAKYSRFVQFIKKTPIYFIYKILKRVFRK
jgi:hypothetical protein